MFDAREWHGKTMKMAAIFFVHVPIATYHPNQPNNQFDRWLLPSRVAGKVGWFSEQNQVHQSTYHAICMHVTYDRPADRLTKFICNTAIGKHQ